MLWQKKSMRVPAMRKRIVDSTVLSWVRVTTMKLDDSMVWYQLRSRRQQRFGTRVVRSNNVVDVSGGWIQSKTTQALRCAIDMCACVCVCVWNAILSRERR